MTLRNGDEQHMTSLKHACMADPFAPIGDDVEFMPALFVRIQVEGRLRERDLRVAAAAFGQDLLFIVPDYGETDALARSLGYDDDSVVEMPHPEYAALRRQCLALWQPNPPPDGREWRLVGKWIHSTGWTSVLISPLQDHVLPENIDPFAAVRKTVIPVNRNDATLRSHRITKP